MKVVIKIVLYKTNSANKLGVLFSITISNYFLRGHFKILLLVTIFK